MNIICNCVRTEKGELTVVNGKAVLLKKPVPMDIRLLVIDDEEMFSKLTPDVFRGFLSVEKIILTDNIKNIPDFAFAHYSFLSTVTFPKTLRSIGDYAFMNCYRLHRIVIPEGVERIGEGAFLKCCLSEVYLPDSVSEIGEKAFYGCMGLKHIYGGRGVKKIADLAFADSSLSSLPFGDALCECGRDAFLRSWDVPARPRFFCDEQFGIKVNENNEFVIDEDVRVLEDRSVDFGGAESVVLPESVRNISRFAFVPSVEKDTPSGDELIRLLPEGMNMPKRYFIGNTSHDYVMSFLLADTVWKDQVTRRDLVNIFLYHKDFSARAEARRRLCTEHDCVLFEMLSFISAAPEKIGLMERVGEYVAAYLSDFSEYALAYFYKRAKKIGAYGAIDTVVKQCFALLNIDEEEYFFGTDGLEPFFAKEFFDVFARRTGCELSELHNVEFRDFRYGSYAPDELVLSILYAYTKQVTTNISDIIEVPHELDIHVCEGADDAAALLDKESFARFVDSLDVTAHGGVFMPFVCRFGSEGTVSNVINKCPRELEEVLIGSLAISDTDKAEQFLANYYFCSSEMQEGETDEYDEDEYDEDEYDEDEYDEDEYEEDEYEEDEYDEDEYDEDEYDEDEYAEDEYAEDEYEEDEYEEDEYEEDEYEEDECDEDECDEDEYDEEGYVEEEKPDCTEDRRERLLKEFVEIAKDIFSGFDVVEENGAFVLKPKKE